MNKQQRFALSHPCHSYQEQVNPRFHWGVVAGPGLYLSVHLTVNVGLDDAPTFGGRPLWHVSGALHTHPTAPAPRRLADWAPEEQRIVIDRLLLELQGVGIPNRDALELADISIGVRRALTNAEIVELRQPAR